MKRFSVYTSDEKSALGLIKELGGQTNYNSDEIERLSESDNKKVSHDEMKNKYKIDENANFTGSWFGLKKPTESNEGLASTVELIKNNTIPEMNENIIKNTNDIENIIPQIKSLTNGIKGVFSTETQLNSTYPNGNGNIYVVEETGGWYYWNNSSWMKGGIYQAKGVDYDTINKYMVYQANFKYNLFNKRLEGFVDNAFLLATTGAIVSSDDNAKNYSITNYIEVKANEVYSIQIAAQEVCCFYDENKNYVGGIKRTESTDYLNYSIVVPSNNNIKYMRVNIKKTATPLITATVVKGSNKFNPNMTIIDWLGVESKNISEKSVKNYHIAEPISPQNIWGTTPISKNVFNCFSSENVISKFIMSDTGVFYDNVNYCVSHFIEVKANEKYTISSSAQEVCCFYDENKNYISGISDLTVTDFTPKTITVPNDTKIKYMRVNIKYSIIPLENFMIYTGSSLPIKYYPFGAGRYSIDWIENAYTIKEVYTEKEVKNLKGKKWLVKGDSITEKNFRASLNYHDYIKEWLGCEVINVAISGTGYINEFGGSKCWLDRIDEFPSDVDFITVMGALNDRTHPVGSFGSEDRTTLYGGLKLFYEKLITKYPNKPIGVITSTPREYSWGKNGTYTGHVNAVIDMAENYSLPILDLYRCSGLRPWNSVNNKEFFSCSSSPEGDGVHPNEKGQLVMAYKIYDFIIQHLNK